MKIDIQALDFSLTDALRRELESRVTDPLSARHEHISGIQVRLGDLNGPRGGKDMYCRIRVEIPGQKDVIVEDVESDMYMAIFRAAGRVNRTVSRRLSRVRERHNSQGTRSVRELKAAPGPGRPDTALRIA